MADLDLLSHCGGEAVGLTHGAVVFRVGWDDIDAVGIVLDAVKNRLGQWAVFVAKLVVLASVIVLRTEDGGGLFPPAHGVTPECHAAPFPWA